MKTARATNKHPVFNTPFSDAGELLNVFSNQVPKVTSSYMRSPQITQITPLQCPQRHCKLQMMIKSGYEKDRMKMNYYIIINLA